MVGSGQVRSGRARQGLAGKAGQRLEWLGGVRQVASGRAWCGLDRHGRRGNVRTGKAWIGQAGMVGTGTARFG